MKWIKQTLPYLLILAVLLVFVVGSEFLNTILPDYKQTIKQYEFSAQKIAYSDVTESDFQGWKEYETLDHGYLAEQDPDYANFAARMIVNILGALDPEAIPEDSSVISSHIEYLKDLVVSDHNKEDEGTETKKKVIYLRNLEYIGLDGQIFCLNLIFDVDSWTLLYFHCVPTGASTETVDTILSGIQQVREFSLPEWQACYYSWSDLLEKNDTSDLEETISCNPFGNFFVRITGLTQQFHEWFVMGMEKSEVFSLTMLNAEYSIYTDNCVLLNFGDGELGTEIPVISLMYDPVRDRICGFGMRISAANSI